jgi:hypothetical protein
MSAAVRAVRGIIFVFIFPFDIHVADMYARIILKLILKERGMEGRNRLTSLRTVSKCGHFL